MALTGDQARQLSRDLIDKYFRTVGYPYTRHHIDSYDQFLQQDMISIIQSQNPILILKDQLHAERNEYKYRVEIYVGGESGTEIEIGTPTVSLQDAKEVRVLYPNEARLRNMTYASTVYATLLVKITFINQAGASIDLSPAPETFQKWPLFSIPIMLHSRFCILHNKPKEFLREAGECPYDNGGYFIVGGAEKVLITRQEQAFNTLYVTPQNDDKIAVFASIECLSAKTRQVKRVAFALMRHVDKEKETVHGTIQVSLPFVRKPVPLFVLFRALGFQSDEEILKMIFPDFESSEAKLLLTKLHPSIIDAFPFMNTYTSIQYLKTLTKGFSEAHILDIIRNQLFIHMPNDPSSQGLFLGDCVRKILRVSEGYDEKTDRDDTRNQRCLTSGFLVQELFNNSYKLWIKAFTLAIGMEYNYNPVVYKDENFKNIFLPGNEDKIFKGGLLNEMIMKGFEGKWGTGLGEEKSGVLQAMSRLSYVDFMSHCRRVILDFDTNMKLTGPRKLHTSQYGYFCTSETPTGASIGITKNLSIMTCISTSSKSEALIAWLSSTGRVYHPEDITVEQRTIFVPVYINGGMFGYTAKPHLLTQVLKGFKRSGCLPYSVSISFSIRDRIVYLYLDAGRPLRPLVWLPGAQLPLEKLARGRTWRDLVMGSWEVRQYAGLDSIEFVDPLEKSGLTLEKYPEAIAPHTGAIEYVDPYEQNDCFIANNPAYITPETTHMEVHPSTIMSMMTSLIPFAPHNQSPRNQLSCSQSKQGLSIYATNWRNRFDNTAHVLCYGEMPLTRTMYNNYLGEGRMAYGMNCILAIACWTGYNQEDGIVMNYDAVHRGMFRSMAFRSYQAFEEDDEKSNTKVRFGNPAQIAAWKDLKPGLDYSKLDDRGIIKEGSFVDETTVIVGAYRSSITSHQIKDASTTPQVWTRGRVEKVVLMVNNSGLRLVKIRVVQDRIPELGDKFSNRHGQKGTIGALLRGHDMPRTESGIIPDMIMNPHAIPSRMTIAQNLEQLLGKAGAVSGSIGDGTSFMNDGSPQEAVGFILENMGFEKYGNEVMYNGATGEQIQAAIFVGPVYGMRLKHMVEDKWQARGQGRKEQRTHQPTAGRGAQGGLKIGEMDRDAIIAHAGMAFVKESFMERSDGAMIAICTVCGTLPIYNPKLGLAICSMCDGPVKYVGDSVHNLEILPPLGRPKSKIVQVEMPYSMKLLTQEQETFLNLTMRYITTSGIQRLTPLEYSGKSSEVASELPQLIRPEIMVPAYMDPEEKPPLTAEQLESMAASARENRNKIEEEQRDIILEADENGEMVQPMGVVNINGANVMVPIQPIGQEQIMANAMAQQMSQQMGPMQQANAMQPMAQQMQPMGQMAQQMQPMAQQMQNQVIYPDEVQVAPPQLMGPASQPMAPASQPASQQGGMIQSQVPGSSPMIVVQTDQAAMAELGLGMPQGRRARRNPYAGGMMGMGSMELPMEPAMPSYTPGGANITVRKLE
jgi:DNA-directed RNA polymerase II subunit RPB2